MDEGTVCFAHGGETGPWCDEILRLAEVARSKGFLTRSPDFSDLPDANARIERLISLPHLSQSRVILVGLDIGAYVTAVASVTLKPAGLFLLAPAFSLQGYGLQRKAPEAGKIIVVHGWDDEKVDYLNAIRFARDSGADLYLLQSDHKLTGQIAKIEMLFSIFLDSLTYVDHNSLTQLSSA